MQNLAPDLLNRYCHYCFLDFVVYSHHSILLDKIQDLIDMDQYLLEVSLLSDHLDQYI